ncbi:magnesium transporter [bacterium]|nr:magnesium transporter [bacterium]
MNEFEEKLLELLEQRRWVELREALSVLPAPEIADLLLVPGDYDHALFFRSLPRKLAAEVFSLLEPTEQDTLLLDLADSETRQLLADLSPDDRTALLEELPAEATRRLMELLNPDDLREVRQLLGYPEESVGRLMTPDYVEVQPDWTIEQALAHIREQGKDSETINMIYVTDKSGKLLDDVRLRRFILANPQDTVESIMDPSFVSLSAFDDQEEAVQMMKRYDLATLPVLDSDGILLGIVTFDDVMDIAEDEATEDMHKVASVAPLKMSYHTADVWTLYRKRIVWLVGLVIVNLVSSGIIAAFEEVLTASIALAFFMPLLIDTGGNTGSQSATIVIRALVTGDVKISQWARIIAKELGVGALLGCSLGILSWGLGIFRGGYKIGVVVGCSMMAIVLVANIVGIILPFILEKFHVDPAVASSPLITTIMDSLGLLIYFSLAVWIL